ncbi:MAG: TIGR03619 family F420-dependent LLM class oxidoreductase [Chloroflexi bacterium]|nr:TIGR03619 family F420-dependent LLM class oxidoreductase [Chloroflexota bacterium]
MEIALGLPQIGAHATREHVIEVAQAAEEGGFDALSVADHVVMPRAYSSRHPDRPDGQLPARYQPDRDLLEPLTLLAFAASVTSRIRLGTAVLVLPMRHPVLHAKILASLAQLAGPGRVYLAAGVGWAREEFEVLSAPWPRRGRRVEEQVALMRALWSGKPVEHHGEFYEVDGWTSRPAPPAPIPVWLGGASEASFRRAGRFADGWFAGIYRLPTYREDAAAVRRAAEEAGRDPTELTFGLGGMPRLAAGHEEACARAALEASKIGVQHGRIGVDARPGEAAELIAAFAARYLDDIHAA